MTGFIRKLISKRPWVVCSSLVTLVFIISNHLLIRGLAAPVWDAYSYFYEYYVLLADAARAGHPLYWNPLSSGGEPVTADPLIGTFSPLNFLIGLLFGGTTRGFVFYWLFVWWLGGAGMLLLARHLRAPVWGGAIVSLGFLFCGIYTSNAEHTPWLTSFSFLPLIIWRLDVALSSRRIWPAFEAGALWGLSALAGYPGFTIVTGMYAAVWALGRLLTQSSADDDARELPSTKMKAERRLRLPLVFAVLATIFLTGAVVMSPSYFSFLYEGAGINERSKAITREAAVTFQALHPGALSTFASPYLMLLKLRKMEAPWPYPDISMSNVYAGVAVTVLAALGLAYRPRCRWRWWLALMAALSIACALGRTLPVRGWLYDYIYPTRFFQHAALFRAYYLFTLSVLAALATKHLRSGEMLHDARALGLFRNVAFILAAVACVAIFLAHLYMPPGSRSFDRVEYFHLAVIWGGTCAVALIASTRRSTSVRRYLPAALVLIAAADALATGFISRPTMMFTNENVLAEWKGFDKDHIAQLYPLPYGLARDYQACDTIELCFNNYHLVTKRSMLKAYSLSLAYNRPFAAVVKDPVFRAAATGQDRVWFSAAAETVAPTEANMIAMMSRGEQLGAAPLLIHSPDEMVRRQPRIISDAEQAEQAARIQRLPGLERVSIKLIRYEPEALAFDVYAPGDGWLLVTERWARSWEATVNSQAAPLYCGDFIFRAVRVKAGSNRVEFAYKPFYLPALIIISWCSLAFVAAGAIYFRRRAMRAAST